MCEAVTWYKDGNTEIPKSCPIEGKDLCYYHHKIQEGLMEPETSYDPDYSHTCSNYPYKVTHGRTVLWTLSE